MTDPTSAATATRWLLTVYTNELNWLFCWSYLLVEPCKYVAPDETLKERLKHWWKTIRNAKETERHLMSPVSKRKYFAFYAAQTILVVTRLVLNLVAFTLLLDAISDTSPSSEDQNVEADLPYQYAFSLKWVEQSYNSRYTVQTFRALKHSNKAKVAGHILLASTGLHVVAYASHRYHLMRKLLDNDFPTWAYWLGHVGIFNWFIDVPGFRVPTVSLLHVVIIIFNITASIVFFCIWYFEKPMINAWGCYAPGSSIEDLKFGVCPEFLNDVDDPLPPVCDQPGVRCGEEAVRWNNMFGHLRHEAFFVMMISFTLYILTVPAKTKFYVLSRDLVLELKKTD